MPRIAFKQPNGLYGVFSTIVDCPVYVNISEIEAMSLATTIKRITYDEMVNDYFLPNNMTKREFKEMCEVMEEENEK